MSIVVQDLVFRLLLAILDDDVCHLERISELGFLCNWSLDDFPR